MYGNLYLIPLPIHQQQIEQTMPLFNLQLINEITHYIVENIRTARRFLKKAGFKNNLDDVQFFLLNKHTGEIDYQTYINPLLSGHHVGLMSESGIPCVADPGSKIVFLAHKHHIRTVPLSGPSSIFLSLAASGLNGQNFAFNGYLPVKRPMRINQLKTLEHLSYKEDQTQIFIETPYRNNQLIHDILSVCNKNTYLCIASEVTSDEAYISTRTIADWKKENMDFHKKNTIFLLHKFKE